MDTTVFEIAARSAGVLPSAVEDAVRRLSGHFETQANPTPEMVSQQLTLLRESAPHLFPRSQTPGADGVPPGVPEAVWKGMSPDTRIAWAREPGLAPAPVARRPRPLMLSAEQAAALAAMPLYERMAAYRALQEGATS